MGFFVTASVARAVSGAGADAVATTAPPVHHGATTEVVSMPARYGITSQAPALKAAPQARRGQTASQLMVYASIHFLLASKKYMIKKRK